MKARDFFNLVAKMRNAQQQFFKTRQQEWVIESKKLERQVDDEIARVYKIINKRNNEHQ